MTTLVTGATGLVGNNLVRKLCEMGQPVRVIVRDGSDRQPLEGLDVEIVAGDVRDQDAINAAVAGTTQVIHAAALVHIGWTGLKLQREINVEGTRIVAQAARHANAKMVHVSSVDALGVGSLDLPADEDSPRDGKVLCSYVISKREAEAAFLEEIKQGLCGVIVNPGFMLGPWDWKPSSGRMILEVANKFTPFAPKGGCSVCDVRDVASGILAALERGEIGRRYILAGENMSYLELWKRIAKLTGGVSPICRAGPLVRIGVGQVGDLICKLSGREPDFNSAAVKMSNAFHYYSIQRAQEELGYVARPADESIADAWQWFLDNGYTKKQATNR